jgi:ribosome-binding factor A
MSQSRRPQRIALQIQQEISLILSRNIKDPRIGMVTITGVQVSPDLRHAKIFASVLGTDEQTKESIEALNHASGWIRHELGQRIRMKFLPELVFREDTSQEYGERIDYLLDKLRED